MKLCHHLFRPCTGISWWVWNLRINFIMLKLCALKLRACGSTDWSSELGGWHFLRMLKKFVLWDWPSFCIKWGNDRVIYSLLNSGQFPAVLVPAIHSIITFWGNYNLWVLSNFFHTRRVNVSINRFSPTQTTHPHLAFSFPIGRHASSEIRKTKPLLLVYPSYAPPLKETICSH